MSEQLSGQTDQDSARQREQVAETLHLARVEADQEVRLAEPWSHAPYTCFLHDLDDCDSADCWALRIVGDETGDLLDFDGCPDSARDAVAYLYDAHQRAVGDEGATYDELVVTRWLLAEARWHAERRRARSFDPDLPWNLEVP